MINVKVIITRTNLDKGNTETVVDLNQNCQPKNLSKVLQSAENLYNAIDDKPTDETRFVRK